MLAEKEASRNNFFSQQRQSQVRKKPKRKEIKRIESGREAGGKPEWKRKQIEFRARMHAWLKTAGHK